MSRRLAIVLSHPTQYFSPWFRDLRRTTTLNFRVFYLWDAGVKATFDPEFTETFVWDVDLTSGYDHEFVPNVSPAPGTHHFGGLRNPDLVARLNVYHPDVVLLFGYKSASHLRTIAWARRNGVRLIFRGDSHLLGRLALPLARRVALRLLYAQFTAITYVGDANRDYFTALGVPSRKLFFAPHAVDSGLFESSNQEHKASSVLLRRQLGLGPSTRVMLFAGKLTAAKQPRELLTAFMALHLPDTALIFVGNGEEKSALVEAARPAPPGSIHFLPFTNQQQMPSRYLAADLFALPSRGTYETWGLAVNEAMAMGLPCLVSDRVGCQRDLVIDDETGWVFRATDPAHLRDRLKAALTADLSRFKPRVVGRISGYSYAAATSGLLNALGVSCEQTQEMVAP